MPLKLALLLVLVPLRCGCAIRTGSSGRSSRIPKTVFITGPFDEESEEASKIIRNVSLISFLQLQSVPDKFGTLRAEGADVKFFDDEAMNESAYQISQTLEREGVVSSAFEAFSLLRPMAFKADLWRYMVLWDQGGVYLDMNVNVLRNLSTWIDFEQDELFLVRDAIPESYWNAVMAARRRNEALEVVIRAVVEAVLDHEYGSTDLDITGPMALYRVLHSIDGIEQHITVQHELFIRSHNCGEFPGPPCSVEIVGTGRRNKDVVIARKEPSLQKVVHGPGHYSTLYRKRAVYCDEPGPPCPGRPPPPE